MNKIKLLTNIFTAKIFSTIISFFWQVSITRNLDIYQVAKLSRILSLQNIIVTFFSLGLSNSVIFHVNRKGRSINEVANVTYNYFFYFSLFFIFFTIVDLGLIRLETNLKLIFSFSVIILILSNINIAFLYLRHHVAIVNYSGAVNSFLLFFSLLAAFLITQPDVVYFYVSIVIGSFCSLFYQMRYNKDLIANLNFRFDFNLFKSLASYGFAGMFANILVLISVDFIYTFLVFISDELNSSEIVAVINRSMIFVNVFLLFFQIIAQPVVVRWSKREIQEVRSEFVVLNSLLLVYSILVIIAFQYSNFLLNQFFGEEYSSFLSMIKLFMYIFPFLMALNLLIVLFLSIGKLRVIIYSYSSMLLLSMLFLYVFESQLSIRFVIYTLITSHFLIWITLSKVASSIFGVDFFSLFSSLKDVYNYLKGFLYDK